MGIRPRAGRLPRFELLSARRFWVALLALLALGVAVPMLQGCKRKTTLEKLRNALADDDSTALAELTEEYPACLPPLKAPPAQGCLNDIATALGGKAGFRGAPPDQESTAAVALLLVRERRADWVPYPDNWIEVLRVGRGPASDALRTAIAFRMAGEVEPIGKSVTTDDEAKDLLKAIGKALPGACATYAALGDGSDEAKLPPEMASDHSPCVQRDLRRKTGPGPKYGVGLWRATAGAMALWKDELAALQEGLPLMDSKVKAYVSKRLPAIIEATGKNTLKVSEPRANEAMENQAAFHGDIPVMGAGGRDGGALPEGGARATSAPDGAAPRATSQPPAAGPAGKSGGSWGGGGN